ncbi:MAG: hypothetical protein IKE24_12175 [Clostridia bacterium]|nr:hypothetical protein [Clostridia bacterium]
MMTEKAQKLYGLDKYELEPVPCHEGGRNRVYICSLNGEKRYVLRISVLDDRTEEDCIYCWYMFDLAHLWMHGVGWYRQIHSAKQRMACMDQYFGKILEGYRSETDVSEAMLEKLPLFIDMTIIEFVTNEFECCAREGGEPDPEDIGIAVDCLVNDIPYGGFGEEW